MQVEDQTSTLLCMPGLHGAGWGAATPSWNGTVLVVDMLHHLAEQVAPFGSISHVGLDSRSDFWNHFLLAPKRATSRRR